MEALLDEDDKEIEEMLNRQERSGNKFNSSKEITKLDNTLTELKQVRSQSSDLMKLARPIVSTVKPQELFSATSNINDDIVSSEQSDFMSSPKDQKLSEGEESESDESMKSEDDEQDKAESEMNEAQTSMVKHSSAQHPLAKARTLKGDSKKEPKEFNFEGLQLGSMFDSI